MGIKIKLVLGGFVFILVLVLSLYYFGVGLKYNGFFFYGI